MTDSASEIQLVPGLTEEEVKNSNLPLPERDSLDEEERAIFDEVLDRSKRFFYSVPGNEGKPYLLTPYFNGLLQSPKVAKLWAAFGDFYQPAEDRGSFTHRERELAEIVVGIQLKLLTGRPHMAPIHIADAVGVGLDPHDIKALHEERYEDLSPEDRQLAEYVVATVRGALTPELFDALAARMGRKTAIEYTSYAVYRVGGKLGVQAMWGIQGRQMRPELGEELLERYIAGTAEAHPHDRGSKWVAPEHKTKPGA